MAERAPRKNSEPPFVVELICGSLKRPAVLVETRRLQRAYDFFEAAIRNWPYTRARIMQGARTLAEHRARDLPIFHEAGHG
jgi:hypothetical protein